jgi:hypothetical protein
MVSEDDDGCLFVSAPFRDEQSLLAASSALSDLAVDLLLDTGRVVALAPYIKDTSTPSHPHGH